MAALAYRDDKILARNLLSHPFFCLTPAEPFFRPDRSSTAPSCRVAVKDGRAFRGHPKGLSLRATRAMARWRSRGGRHAWQQSTARHHGDRRGFPVPVPASLQKSGNSHREVHRLSRFRDHRTAWSCLPCLGLPPDPGREECDDELRPTMHAAIKIVAHWLERVANTPPISGGIAALARWNSMTQPAKTISGRLRRS